MILAAPQERQAVSRSDFRIVRDEGCHAIATGNLELSVCFVREVDRWVHSVSLGCVGKIAQTVEGYDGRDEPARVVSPVYQELQDHSAVPEICTLLTGQSTPHHFSAVVTAKRDGRTYALEFDVADRCRAPVEYLAATYVVSLGSSELVEFNHDRITWGGGRLGEGRLEFTTGGVDDVALAEAGRQATRIQALARLVATTHTQRLFYSWRWTPPALEETR